MQQGRDESRRQRRPPVWVRRAAWILELGQEKEAVKVENARVGDEMTCDALNCMRADSHQTCNCMRFVDKSYSG